MGSFYSPEGNFEVWEEKPEGYLTAEEWFELHPPEPPPPAVPDPDYYELINDVWTKVRYSKKSFMLWCGIDKIVAINAAIAGGNMFVYSIKDLLMAADYIDILDPDTVQMVQLLTTPTGGNILSLEEAGRILTGEVWVEPEESEGEPEEE
jgi:hypothetical protein